MPPSDSAGTWKLYQKDLELLTDSRQDAATRASAGLRMAAATHVFAVLPPAPYAKWKALVKGVVPQLLRACVSTAQQHNSSCSSSQVAQAAVAALQGFLHLAHTQAILKVDARHAASLNTLQQQLSQSGLLQLLPTVLQKAEQQLTAHLAHFKALREGTLGESSSSSSDRGRSDGGDGGSSTSVPVGQLQQATADAALASAAGLLLLFQDCCQLWPAGTDRYIAMKAVAVAVLQLAPAVLQYVNVCMQQQQGQAQPRQGRQQHQGREQQWQCTAADLRCWYWAVVAAFNAAQCVFDRVLLPGTASDMLDSMPELWQLALSPHYTQCVILVLCRGFLTNATLQLLSKRVSGLGTKLIDTIGQTQPSGLAALFSQGAEQVATATWDEVCSLQQSIFPQPQQQQPQQQQQQQQQPQQQQSLVTQQQQLFELLGLDSRVVLWAAVAGGTAVPMQWPGSPKWHGWAAVTQELQHAYWVQSLLLQEKQLSVRQLGGIAAAALQQQLHMLLPAVLLSCAAGSKGSTGSAGVPMLAELQAAWVTNVSLQCWQSLQHVLYPQAGKEVGAGAADADAPNSQLPLFLGVYLPAVLRIAERAASHVTAGTAGCKVASGRQQDGGSSSGGSTSSGGSGAVAVGEAHWALSRASEVLVWLLRHAAAHAPEDNEVGPLAAQALQPHLLRCLSALDTFVRTALVTAAQGLPYPQMYPGLTSVARSSMHVHGTGVLALKSTLSRCSTLVQPDSPEMQQLYSLLASLLKLAASSTAAVLDDTRIVCGVGVAETASMLLQLHRETLLLASGDLHSHHSSSSDALDSNSGSSDDGSSSDTSSVRADGCSPPAAGSCDGKTRVGPDGGIFAAKCSGNVADDGGSSSSGSHEEGDKHPSNPACNCETQPAAQPAADAQTGPSEGASSGCGAVHLLPSLTLFGRCCLRWAQELRDILSRAYTSSQGFERVFQQWISAAGIDLASDTAKGTALDFITGKVQAWLQAEAVKAELQAAGFKPEQLLRQLAGLQEELAAQDADQTDTEDEQDVLLEALAMELASVGTAFSAVAVPAFCNNPSCSSVSGPTELQLVSGRSCMCAGCLAARYCCRDCQKQHWKQHRPVCKAMAAAGSCAEHA